jgi:serine/threonine protein kinase
MASRMSGISPAKQQGTVSVGALGGFAQQRQQEQRRQQEHLRQQALYDSQFALRQKQQDKEQVRQQMLNQAKEIAKQKAQERFDARLASLKSKDNPNGFPAQGQVLKEIHSPPSDQPPDLPDIAPYKAFLEFDENNVIRVNRQNYGNLGLIGEGAFGRVFKVIRLSDSKIFALKNIVCDTSASLEYHETIQRFFNEEVSLLQAVRGLPFIIQAEDFSTCDAVPENGRVGCCQMSIVFQYAETSLLDFVNYRSELQFKFDPNLKSNPNIAPGFSVDVIGLKNIWHSLLQCVSTLHKHDIVHRDIKPDNFVLCGGVITLIDLGLSAKLPPSQGFDDIPFVRDRRPVTDTASVGTLEYMAPEVAPHYFSGNASDLITYTPAVDIWSLGITLFHLVTGEFPFEPVDGWWETFSPDQLFQNLRLSVPSLENCIKKCLRMKPETRPTADLLLLDDEFLQTPGAFNNTITVYSSTP